MENSTSPSTRLSYQNNAMSSMDRKIQYKMFDRERDYCWQVGMGTDTLQTARSLKKWDDDNLKNLILRQEKAELGEKTKWDDTAFPMAYMCSDDNNMVSSSRLYEMMKDHSLSDGEMTFPIMGHPFWISVGRKH